MNDKKAKKLRRLAFVSCDGNFDRHLVSNPSRPRTALNHPRTFRGIYRYLKRFYDPNSAAL